MQNTDSNKDIDSSPFSNHEAILKSNSSGKSIPKDKFNELTKFNASNANDGDEDSQKCDSRQSLDHDINQLSYLSDDNFSAVDEDKVTEDKLDGEQSNNNENSNNEIPDNFTNMLIGNKEKDAEKVFYFSTLNSQDKLENIIDAELDDKKK
nr:hypothetical protein [Candidatus Bandiella numerosa]